MEENQQRKKIILGTIFLHGGLMIATLLHYFTTNRPIPSLLLSILLLGGIIYVFINKDTTLSIKTNMIIGIIYLVGGIIEKMVFKPESMGPVLISGFILAILWYSVLAGQNQEGGK